MASLVEFATALPDDIVRRSPEDLAPHLVDWRGLKRGRADLLLLPRDTADVQLVVGLAGAHRIALVPQGGNTGLVGGSVPEAGGDLPVALLSMRRMNAIGAVDPAGLTMVVGAGAILAAVHEAAEGQGCRFPLSLGSRGTATIGGLVSTNAGGVQVLRHGTMRGLVLGLEAVLPDGSLLDQLAPLRKDNSGYDLKQLLIGAEGTLGVVTRAALRLAPALPASATAWVGLAGPDAALALLAMLRAEVGEVVESFELIGCEALDLVLATIPAARPPLAGRHRFHVLIELGAEAAKLEAVLARALDLALAQDAVVAASAAQAAALWSLREAIPEAEKREGGAVKNDVAVAVADVPAFHAAAIALYADAMPEARPLVFGHLGDGNLHWNLRPPAGPGGAAWIAEKGEEARCLLHDLVCRFHGSISAEHGIGTLKIAELARVGDPGKLSAMRAIKAALDPQGIMNPGKMFAAGS